MINVLEHGVSHDFVDQSDKINKLLEADGALYFPNGFYRIDKPINLFNNTNLVGDGATFVVLGDFAIIGTDLTNVEIKGFAFTIDCHKTAIKLQNVTDAEIKDIKSSGGAIFIHATDADKMLNKHILIDNVVVDNPNWQNEHLEPTLPYTKGVYVENAEDVKISNCTIDGMSQGIQLWGGNSANDKVLKCKNVIVDGCVVKNCSGGGIWGSNVENFTISNSIVDYTLDVGIDFEGCHSALSIGNIVSNTRCGNYAIFAECDNVTFANCISKCDRDKFGAHFSLYNSANYPYQETIVIDGCQFLSTNGKVGEVTFGSCRHRIVKNCYFLNSKLCYNLSTSGHVNSEIKDNKFYFNQNISNLSVITAQSHNNLGYHTISNNTIQVGDGELGIAKASNVIGIECVEYNAEGRHIITDNLIYGVNVGIQGRQNGNKTLYIVANDNIMNSGIKTIGSVNVVKNNNISISGSARW